MCSRALTNLIAVLVASSLVLAACGSGGSTAASTTSNQAAATPPSTARPIKGTLDVFAAASLTAAFNSAKATLAASNSGLSLTYNFAGSNALVTQIQQGDPADVFASADTKNMDKLVAAGLVETPATFARTRLEIAVAPGNPKHITGLSDLAKTGVTVVLEAVGVPAGDYTRSVLASQHITVNAKSMETDVKSALAKVASGEADATVVYVTDVQAAGSTVTGITIPDSLQPTITYPIAVVKATKDHATAQAFVDSAVSGEVQKALEAAGFLPPH